MTLCSLLNLRRHLAALPWREIEVAPGVFSRYIHQGEMLDALDALIRIEPEPEPEREESKP